MYEETVHSNFSDQQYKITEIFEEKGKMLEEFSKEGHAKVLNQAAN